MRVSPRLAVCLAGSAGALLSLATACRNAPVDVDPEQRAALIRAFGPLRPVEGRLAGVPFAPYRPAGPAPEPQDAETWKQVQNDVEARVASLGTSAAFANQALVKLALGDPLAIESLEKAVASPRQPSARVWSDLAAVRLANAEAAREPHRLIAALEAADRALAIDPRLPEALFNRAKIAERLGQRWRAIQDWQHYLAEDDLSPWTAEARQSLGRLRQPSAAERWTQAQPRLDKAVETGDGAVLSSLVDDFPDRAHSYLDSKVFPAWAAAIELGDSAEAARWRRAARALASQILRLTRDPFDSEAVSAIESVPPALARDLARAHLEYAKGADLYDDVDYTSARPRFAAAREGFERARSPFVLLVRYKLAACDYWLERKEAGLAAAREVLGVASQEKYWSLAGWSGWLLGLAELERGLADPAQRTFVAVRDAFHQTREAKLEASIESLLANCLWYLGKRDEAWHSRRDALLGAVAAGDSRPLTTIFSAAARTLSDEGKLPEATIFQGEVLPVALSSGDHQRIAEAYLWRARIDFRAEDVARAQREIAKADAECKLHADQVAIRPTRAAVDAAAGEIWLRTDPQRALDSLTQALAIYKDDNAYSRSEILRLRAQAQRALKHDGAAEGDLVQAVKEYERLRTQIEPGPLQVAYFERARPIFDDLVALELELGHPDRAFDTAERAKARALLDSLAARRLAPAHPLTAARVDRSLPAGTVLVEYAVLDDRVVVWVRETGRGDVRAISWAKAGLAADVASLTESIVASADAPAAATAAFESQSGRFFERLIAPVLDRVPEGATLVVVPDGALRGLPFAALRDARSGRFLIERNPLVVAPSATIFLASSDRRPGPPRDRWRSLAVGGAEINQRLYPDHGTLPETETEAAEIARFHPGSLLVHESATIPNFLDALDRYELIHFAGHAGMVTDPPRAALLFTPVPGAEPTGALDVDAIAAQRLSRPRLAVLAACSAAGGSGLGLEGDGDLARSFFEAGVPAVLGNLWTLGDKDASRFLEEFYRTFWAGVSATSALQAAQIAMIHSPDTRLQRPAVWGGFRLLGTAAGQRHP